MGIGLAREGDYLPLKTPAYNAFLNLNKVRRKEKLRNLPKDWVNGYVVHADGVYLGLTAANTAEAGFVKLQPWPEYSTPELPEWMLAPVNIKVNGVSSEGTNVVDTGIKFSLIDPPYDSNLDPLVDCPGSTEPQCVGDGNIINVYFPNQTDTVAFYTIIVGQKGNPMQPDYMTVVDRSGVYFNTSRLFLQGMNLIYDNKNGYVGYIWNGNTSSEYGYVKPSE